MRKIAGVSMDNAIRALGVDMAEWLEWLAWTRQGRVPFARALEFSSCLTEHITFVALPFAHSLVTL